MIFSVEQLSAGYRGKRVLEDVCFAIQPHKITALLGRNGCGKSTLLACVNQQVAYTGKILCCDRDVCFMTPRERAAARGRFCRQVLAVPSVTVRELTAFGRAPYNGWGGRLSEADHRIIAQAMADAGVAEMADRLVPELSGGERQKAYIAMILAQNTRLVLLDEPTPPIWMRQDRRRLCKCWKCCAAGIKDHSAGAARSADSGTLRRQCGGAARGYGAVFRQHAGMSGQRRTGRGILR